VVILKIGPEGNSEIVSMGGFALAAQTLTNPASSAISATRSMSTPVIMLILTGKNGSSAKTVTSGCTPIAKSRMGVLT